LLLLNAMEAPVVISVAGSDNSAGAGIQADLKTFTYFKVFGQTVVTCVVAEVPGRVAAIRPIDPETVKEQLTLSLEYFPVRALKTGMLYSAQIIRTVCDVIESLPAGSRPSIVVDPVMMASSGDLLLEADAVAVYRDRLIPLASVVTPNLDEAGALSHRIVRNLEELEQVGRSLAKEYKVAFLIKGGHLPGTEATDVLFVGEHLERFSAPFQTGLVTHGTGCTLSAAITANLALGKPLEEAIQLSKDYISRAISDSLSWGKLGRIVTALKHW
jgi:hydroxymethylpyrimidine/phosphomethylpyrimidine kinase